MNRNHLRQEQAAPYPVIDLTSSFTLAEHDIPSISNVVTINLDDSKDDLLRSTTAAAVRPTKTKISSPTISSIISSAKQIGEPPKKSNIITKQQSVFGECPICWDELGINPMASTTCGHVFCYKCLQNAVKINKSCPTCRHSLKKRNFHPLYI